MTLTARTRSRADASLDLALTVLAGVRAEAERRGAAMGAAVVDAGGNLVAAIRMDGAQLVALPLATDKAYTAVALDAPTETWAGSTAPGGADWGMSTALGGRLVVFAGGLPIHADGALVGGVGVSGAAAAVDRACALAGLAAAGLEG
ncbi:MULTISPECIES: GlcG/HbpS family heme-binding protein [unclassified Geodermatophilus]